MALPPRGPGGVPSITQESHFLSQQASIGSVLIGASELSTDRQLDNMANTLVNGCVFTISAQAGGDIMGVTDVAIVRDTAPGEASRRGFVIDFQRMRTVSLISGGDIRIYRVYPWLGTKFGTASNQAIYSDDGGTEDDIEFPEQQTERLMLITEVTSIDHFKSEVGLRVPAPPSELELLVNGKRVWFRPGPVRPDVGKDVFTTDVDLAAEIQAAVDGGASTIIVTLKSATPGLLTLSEPDLDMFRVHNVIFPEGEIRTVVADEEGLTKVALPVPGGATSWTIHQVRFSLGGEVPDTRIQPSDGPPPDDEVQLALDAEHAAVALLPSVQLDAFANLHAVRIRVATGPGGAEVAGVLRADLDGEPGEIIDAPSLGPVSLDEIDPAAPVFITLALPRPRKLEKLTPLWVAVQVSRGTLIWPVTVPAPSVAPRNPIRRGLPAGPFRRLPALTEITNTELGAVIRVVGEPSPDVPIPPIEAWVEGSGTRTPLPLPLESAGVNVTPPRSGGAAGVIAEGALQLQLRANTPGTFSFRAAKIVRAA